MRIAWSSVVQLFFFLPLLYILFLFHFDTLKHSNYDFPPLIFQFYFLSYILFLSIDTVQYMTVGMPFFMYLIRCHYSLFIYISSCIYTFKPFKILSNVYRTSASPKELGKREEKIYFLYIWRVVITFFYCFIFFPPSFFLAL